MGDWFLGLMWERLAFSVGEAEVVVFEIADLRDW